MGYPITYYPPEARVLPLTLIRRERILPMPGRVIAVPGEHVQPTQIVAQTDATDDVRILNVARLLHVAPSKAHRYLKVKQGDDVHLGTLIAASGIFSANRLFSPVDGFIAKIDAEKGRVFIQAVTKPVELTAFLQGTIANVMGSRGVVIETTGAIVQATVGFGGESFGVLHVVSNEADDVLRAKSIDVSSHGAIVVGGAWIDESALQQAQQLQVRGIIAGSMEGRLLEKARSLSFPILLIEGLGRVAMARPIFKLLKSHSGREASISAITRTRWGMQRPEILIPLPAESKPAPPPDVGVPLSVGLRVHVVRGPHLGAVGTITALHDRPMQIESGAQVYGVEVSLDPAGKVFVPLANLEVLR